MSISKSALNSVVLVSEKILVIGLAFAVSVLLARVGGTELFGQYAYITSFAGMFAPLCIMGLNNIVTKYVVRYPSNSHFYVSAAIIVRLIGALAALLLGVLTLLIFNQQSQLSGYIVLLLVFQIANALLVYEYFFLAKKQVTKLAITRLSIALVATATKITIIAIEPNVLYLVLCQGFEYLLISACYWYLYQQGQHSTSLKRAVTKSACISLGQKGKWLLLSGLAAVVYLRIDQIMIAHLLNTEQVAYYAAAAKLSEFWYAFPIIIANAYNPLLLEQNKTGLNHLLLKLLRLMVVTAVIISLLTLLLADNIVLLIYGDNYLASAPVLAIHIFASIFIFQRAFFSKWLIIENLLKFSLVTHGIGAVINLILNWLLIPSFGIEGAAWATVISYAFASFFALFIAKQTREFGLLMLNAMLTFPKAILFSKAIKQARNKTQ